MAPSRFFLVAIPPAVLLLAAIPVVALITAVVIHRRSLARDAHKLACPHCGKVLGEVALSSCPHCDADLDRTGAARASEVRGRTGREIPILLIMILLLLLIFALTQ